MNPPLSARRLAALLLAFAAARCANLPRKTPAGAPQPPAPSPSPVSTRAAPGRPAARTPIPVPADAAPSGTLLRIGWKSDVSEFVFGPPGQRWVVVSQGQAELLRGTLRVKPEPAGFQVQAGAFSQEEPARDRAGKLAADFQTSGSVAFSADRGVYRVLLGNFSDRAAAEALAEKLRGAGEEALVAEGGGPLAGPRAMGLTGEDGEARRLLSPVDLYPSDGEARILLDGKPYRGSLRVLVNPRGTLNVVNRVDLEEYLYGVVPSEMGPRRYDEIEALKAQAVAARTYALAHRGQFGAEDYDLCATAKCQVYSGLSVEDPLSNAAVDATRGLVLAHEGKLADALFTSTCGGRTEDVANVFGEPSMPYLVSVECGELDTITLPGRVVDRRAPANARSGLEWRGYVVAAHAVRKKGARAAALATAQKWAGVGQTAAPAATLSPAAVYPSLVAAFDLVPARALHLLPQQERYFSEAPAASGRLSGAAREAYDFLLRLRFGAGEALPPPDRNMTEEEYAGLLFSAALRLTGVTEAAGRFVRREGSNLWVKTPEGRQGLPVDPDLPLARRVGDHFFPAASLTLRPGDRLRWWKRGGQILALWVELDAAGPSFERESAWTEWVRRASGRELARRMAARVAGTEVREIAVTRRSPSGRVIGARVTTDTAQIALARFDVRQALEIPELAFTVTKARGQQGEIEFVFLGRGWGHGVGLCQNGAYGMAIAGAAYDAILRHYYTGIQIVPAGTVVSR
ncbi:MAG TPA: SpoIID/LytB domain-containing protein [Thermoanaerobaculia bacterium]|nr:SpoIID/LytB domain-containing protein [Thermoanaerobaculia bacterium]